MDQVSGVYAGKQIWVSSYHNNNFEDRIVSIEEVEDFDQHYVTSEIDSIIGITDKECALAYYAYSSFQDKRAKQKKIFELICQNDIVKLFVFEDQDQKQLTEILHQEEHLSEEESEPFIAAKSIINLFADQYPESVELTALQNKFEDYENNIVNGEVDDEDKYIKEVITHIYEQINFKDNAVSIDLMKYNAVIKKGWYMEQVSEDVTDSIVALVRKMLGRIDNNFEDNDIVYLYLYKFLYNPEIRFHIDSIAKSSRIEIRMVDYAECFVSRGNAYHNYLINYIQFNRINENVGRYILSFEDNTIELSKIKDNISFVTSNDFYNQYVFRLTDQKTQSFRDIKMSVPFSVNGTTLLLSYNYNAACLTVSIKDCNSEELYTEHINY